MLSDLSYNLLSFSRYAFILEGKSERNGNLCTCFPYFLMMSLIFYLVFLSIYSFILVAVPFIRKEMPYEHLHVYILSYPYIIIIKQLNLYVNMMLDAAALGLKL